MIEDTIIYPPAYQRNELQRMRTNDVDKII